MNTDPIAARLRTALERDDRAALEELFRADGDSVRAVLNAPTTWAPPPVATARSRATARLLVEYGADLALVSAWWAQGFCVVTNVDPDVGAYLVEAGAEVTPHAAAGLGLDGTLRAMFDDDPGVVHAKGGDGCRPLHFARDVATAQLLLDAGADIDARDDDHDSTAAQWLIGDVPEVAAYLVARGATADIFLAAALGDRGRVEQRIDGDPDVLTHRVGLRPTARRPGFRGPGGPIYQWTLGFNSFAHQYALKRGHTGVYETMLARSDTKTRFLVACVTADRPAAEAMVAKHPDLVASLPKDDLELLARYCWETNVDLEAVRLMLDVGWPTDVPETSHAYLPLHNAAWGGYADLVDLLIARGAPVDVRDPMYDSTPLGFAIHCCCEDGRHPEGDYTRVVNALIDAGCPWDPSIYPTGHAKIDAALAPRVG